MSWPASARACSQLGVLPAPDHFSPLGPTYLAGRVTGADIEQFDFLKHELFDVRLDALQCLGAGFVVLLASRFQLLQGGLDFGFGSLEIGHGFASAVVDG